MLSLLTERERQIMQLVSEGLSNKEIGLWLDISDGTIKVHLHNIYQKLSINNRTTLAALAMAAVNATATVALVNVLGLADEGIERPSPWSAET